jgi:hypothetical protein
MTLAISERRIRYGRMAKAIFGNHATWYEPNREGWYEYWRHQRICRALRRKPYELPAPWLKYQWRKGLWHPYPGIPGRNGKADVEDAYQEWRWRYFLGLRAIERSHGYDMAFIEKFRRVILKEENP